LGRAGRRHELARECNETDEQRAERLVREWLQAERWSEEDLRRHPKGDAVKVAAALRLRRETTMTLKWISQRLAMGAWTHLNKRLYEQRKASS